MTSHSKTRTIIFSIILPSLLGAALIAVCFWGASERARADSYQTTAQSMYRRAYSELNEELNDLEVTLSKLQIVGSRTQYVLLLDDVWRSCGTCTGLMSQIPSSHLDTESLNKFIVRLGDYAHTLSGSVLRGSHITVSDTDQISELRNACLQLSSEISQKYDSGDIPIEQMNGETYFSEVKEGDEAYSSRESIEKLPSLIYDGPFSESSEKAEPKGLSGADVSADDAKRIAETLSPDGATVSYVGESNGKIPAYEFSGKTKDDREFDMSISKQGGKLIWYMGQSTSDTSGIPDDSKAKECRDSAHGYLITNGYSAMESTYAQYYGGTALINFAATQDDVILYNDLVKVWVDVETLEVVGVDARNYLYSHVERSFPNRSISMDDAETMLSENLEILSKKVALIPITPTTEVLCYEFKGRFGDEEYIVYVNVESGIEEQIFKIINSDDGTLVI